MPASLTLTFRRLARSNALEASARDIGNRLQSLNNGITHCQIELVGDADGAREPRSYHVKIHVSVPGAQIHAASSHREGHSEMRSALYAAYENAKRQLERLKRLRSIQDAHAHQRLLARWG